LNKQDLPSNSTNSPESILQQIQELTAHVMSDDSNRQLESTQVFRKLLSIGEFSNFPLSSDLIVIVLLVFRE
jgi:hypothetical protein